MKEDVVAANLANLRQSINELKECVNRQNVTPNQPEQHIKVDLDEKIIYNGVAKSFCTCWNDALSVVKKHIWNQQPDTLPFSLWFPKIVDLFKQKSRFLEYIYSHVCDYNLNRMIIEANTENILKRLTGFLRPVLFVSDCLYPAFPASAVILFLSGSGNGFSCGKNILLLPVPAAISPQLLSVP